MKFSILAHAILAIPAPATAIPDPVGVTEDKRANCKLTPVEVQLFKVNAVKLENVQCFWTDGIYVLDVSEVQGPAGYAQYKNQHNLASKTFSRGTGCDVIQNL
ncbi:hypothetical protein FNYG_02800 [Fusarium nygamai]|uniref:Uncharacterized protein n=1 Tax=Gibberella nygamai TaxID=42673 RepID=A0A2K0WPB8_GIBNY|nr:hypothetical protein FNYG_02800 [Fusarium nygamai]